MKRRAGRRQKTSPEAANGPSHALNSAITMAVTWSTWYFAGPILSWASRSLWEKFCLFWYVGHYEGFWGTIMGNARWFTNCMPMGEHIGNYAYRWSDGLITVITGSIVYSTSHGVQKFLYRAQNIAKAGAQRLEDDIDEGLDRIQHRLEEREDDDIVIPVRNYTPYRHRRSASASEVLPRSEHEAIQKKQRLRARPLLDE